MRRGRARSTWTVVIALVGALAFAGAPANGGQPPSDEVGSNPFEPPSAMPRFQTLNYFWKGNPAVITVKNTIPKLREPVKKALAVWNRSGIDIRWKLEYEGKTDVVVRDYGEYPCGFGLATTRFDENSNRATQAKVQIGMAGRKPAKCIFTHTLVAAHEFGHVLGLAHEDGACALMNSVLFALPEESGPDSASPARCEPPAEEGYWFCRVLAEDDLLGAKSIYGGEFTVRDPEFCPVTDGL